MKLRYFYKIDHKKQPIPGSNIKRKSKPMSYSQWREIDKICCNPEEIDCTCGPRFFVQVDAGNRPVSGSLIKRFVWPKMEQDINYQELNWKDVCCPPTPEPSTYSLTFGFLTNGEDSDFSLTIGGALVSSSDTDIDPPYIYNNLEQGVQIIVTVTNNGENGFAGLNISGGTTYTNEEEGTITYIFNLNGNTTIEAYTDPML